MRTRIITAVLVAFASACCSAATFIVSASGGDYTNFTTLFAGEDLAPGDVVEARASTEGGSWTVCDSITPGADDAGSAESQLTIVARAGDTILVDGENTRDNGIELADANDYIIINGFSFDNFLYACAYVNDADHCVLSDHRMTIQLTHGASSRFGIVVADGSDSITISNNVIATDIGSIDEQSDGINCWGSSCVISSNHITLRNATADAGAHNDCIQTDNAANVLIERNWCDQTILREYNQGIYVEFYNYSDETPTDYGTVIIRNNVVFGYGGSYLFQSNQRPFGAFTNTAKVSFNIFNNVFDALNTDTSLPFHMDVSGEWNSSGTQAISNNVFIVRRSNAFAQYAQSYDVPSPLINNNVIYCPNATVGQDVATIAGTGYTWAEWQAAGNDVNGVGYNIDPLLSSSYRSLAGSPCINAGADLSSYFTTDITGKTRTGDWDIGAYEYGRVLRTTTLRAGNVTGP